MKMNNFFVKSVFFIGMCAFCCAVNAAENGHSRGGAMSTGATAARMPSIPIVTMNVIGNPAVTAIQDPVNNFVPQPTPPQPTPSQCADGGEVNTEYTIERCMGDLQSCVNTNVENGLMGLYNDDYFHSILNGGVRICQHVVDRCLTVRKDCKNVYRNTKAVWIDFRARILQPSYYNFVLRKTGLTPYQAVRTCARIGGRWDAVNADCSVRVVAYNKSKKISNEWLFGAAGNGKDAEAWVNTGETFSCGKNLFGFSLLNDTATAAVVGIGGGAVVGAATGGIIAKHKQNKENKDPCKDSDFRGELGRNIAKHNLEKVLANYYTDDRKIEVVFNDDGTEANPETVVKGTKEIMDGVDYYKLNRAQCQVIMEFYKTLKNYEFAIDACVNNIDNSNFVKTVEAFAAKNNITLTSATMLVDGSDLKFDSVICGEEGSVNDSVVNQFLQQCTFHSLLKGFSRNDGANPVCNPFGEECVSYWQIKYEMGRLQSLLDAIKVKDDGKNPTSVGKGMLVGGAIGVGVGGLATGITALIERDNIKCEVEKGLGSVAFGKSHTVDSLRTWYVRYGLNLPDTVLANTPVTDKNSWGVACSEFQGNSEDCQVASIIYKHNDKREVVPFACSYVGSMCLMDKDVADFYGIK